ncbi:MAG: hypothetical protein DRO40_08275 [Thermoprotei archaeon]|nr:MAG: hypothetical protein DRO40_08275 [Thermoprotei archaeon]
MEYRYLLAGINISLISIVFIVFGIFSGNSIVLGISLSTLVLGVLLITIGLTYVPPLHDLLKTYSNDLTMFANKLLEDSGLISSHEIRICYNKDIIQAVFTNGAIDCRKVLPGIGIVDNVPYISFPVKDIVSILETEYSIGEGIELRDYLKDILVNRYIVSRDIIVDRENSVFKIELWSLTKDAKELLNKPVNPIRIIVPVFVSRFFERNIIVMDEEIIGNNYVIKMRVG